MDILRFTGNPRQNTANSPNDELNFNPRQRRLRQLVDDLALGDGICLDADITGAAQRDLTVHALQQHGLDPEG